MSAQFLDGQRSQAELSKYGEEARKPYSKGINADPRLSKGPG
jgi:hypothetical protein